MAKHLGATDAFNMIVQKVDEALIQAEAYLRNARLEGEAQQSANSEPEVTVVPPNDRPDSERSCSPSRSRTPSSQSRSRSTFSSSSSSASSIHDIHVKSKSYVALDRKKALVMTSFKSDVEIADSEVKKVQKLIEDLFGKKSSSSSSFLQL